MEILQFLIGNEQFPVYRTVTPEESSVLRGLLGNQFRFPLEEGEPMDDLMFDVLAAVAMRCEFFFTPPPEAAVVGTFELRDASVPAPETPITAHRLYLRPRIH